MTEQQHYVVRAAWQVLRDMNFELDISVEFRTRLEAQIEKWQLEDELNDPQVLTQDKEIAA